MLCEKCKNKEAVIRFTQIINDEKSTVNLCQECAEVHGIENPVMDLSKVFGKLIVNILSDLIKNHDSEPIQKKDSLVCSNCGLTYEEFKRKGLLGCENCYSDFYDELKVLLRRLHGNNQHITYTKEKQGSVQKARLKTRLKMAIKKEDYEQAAELRDQIDAMNHREKK